MEKDGLTDLDAVRVLRAGAVREAEWDNAGWRHKVETPKMVFVVTFDPEVNAMPKDNEALGDTELILVTAWKIRK